MNPKCCQNCSRELPENDKLIFCPYCLSQVKCQDCKEFLIKDAVGCISCGKKIEINSNSLNAKLNEIEFEQKGDSKKFKASFSDNVGHELVNTFGGMLGISIPKKKSFINPLTKSIGNNEAFDSDSYQDADIIEYDEDITNNLKNVFKIDGDKLIFTTSNLKEKNKIDKEIRMSLLTLLGYKHLHNSEQIKRVSLTDILKKSKLNTGNFRKWISKCDEIVQSSGGMIELTPKGNTSALQILNEVLDINISKGNVVFGKISTNKKRTNIKNEITTSSTSKTGKTPKEYLLKLIEENFFNKRRTLSDITTELKDNHATTIKSTDISGHMGNFVKNKKLKREKGDSGYEYFS